MKSMKKYNEAFILRWRKKIATGEMHRYNCFEGMEEKEKGKFYLFYSGQHVPLRYSIKGTKIT